MFQLAWRETDFKKVLWRKTHFGRRMAGTKVQQASGRKLVSKYSWRETEEIRAKLWKTDRLRGVDQHQRLSTVPPDPLALGKQNKDHIKK